MRKFSSYGQINTNQHYYAPRTALIERAYAQLRGEHPDEGGHYITVWAPRQTGKSSMMLETVKRLRQHEEFEVVIITAQSAKNVHTDEGALGVFVDELHRWVKRELPQITEWKNLPDVFTREYFPKPLILIIDEFDAFDETYINHFANEFRKIYTDRLNESDTPTADKQYMLHSLALIGVRSVLGIENAVGSPFNVQRSLHIPNLTYDEVAGLFKWYERESGQAVETDVIKRLYAETSGHPGLTCWFGELLTEGFEDYHVDTTRSITMNGFERVYAAATYALPNNTILNIISKAKQEPHKQFVLNLFQTEGKIDFTYDTPEINFLYQNGVIDREIVEGTRYYIKFSCAFVQKRLFNYFSTELFQYMGKLHDPFVDLEEAVTETTLCIPGILRYYQRYLQANKDWLFKNAPRRADLRIYEAVYHFNLYMYLHKFLQPRKAKVWPEFPTGNGKIDLLVEYQGQLHGLEVKSFTNIAAYNEALRQAAWYGKQLQLTAITLILFIDTIDEEYRTKYEAVYHDSATHVTVQPVFVATDG